MSFACIFVPDFPTEAFLRAEPESRAQAVVVLEGKPPLEKVFSLNQHARQAGIEPGMTKIQVEACTGLVLRSRSVLQEDAAHAALLDCAQSFSPVVEDTACDTILLDLAGLEPLFGSPSKLACGVARRASDIGLEAHVAVASNPDAAMLAARGFPGVTVIEAGEEAERLGGLPLEVLFGTLSGSGKEAEQVLEIFSRWGLRNLRALAALPEIPLAERLGQKGVHLQQLARGAVSRTLVPVDLPLIFEENVELEFPLVLLEPLAFLLQHMLEQLCTRLASRALAVQELRLRLELESGYLVDESTDPITSNQSNFEQDPPQEKCEASSTRASLFVRTLRLPVPMLDAKIFLKLLQLDLKAHPPGAPIRKIHLSAEPARPRPAQNGLFLPASPQSEKLELTLARISGIVGEDKVGAPGLLDTHRPDAFCMQHFVPGAPDEEENQNSSDKKKSGSTSEKCPPVTALRIFRPPRHATVTVRDGKPVRISCPKHKELEGEIHWLAGPWRSSGDWWQQGGWMRDEWDIALQQETGIALYRLVRNLLSGRWFVEGTYD